ncbi:hypothetical protein, partial [Serratia marcescens]|uniref:hypothetical protein n=1 Tax=Serratia marcescens TaxID=615 RepID=UPI00158E03B5
CNHLATIRLFDVIYHQRRQSKIADSGKQLAVLIGFDFPQQAKKTFVFIFKAQSEAAIKQRESFVFLYARFVV